MCYGRARWRIHYASLRCSRNSDSIKEFRWPNFQTEWLAWRICMWTAKTIFCPDLSYNVSSVSRESLLGMDGVHGYKETPHAGFISATLRDAGGLTVADFNAMTNVTVTVELANGKTVVGRNMWTVETQETKAAEGTFEVKWEGPFVEEI